MAAPINDVSDRHRLSLYGYGVRHTNSVMPRGRSRTCLPIDGTPIARIEKGERRALKAINILEEIMLYELGNNIIKSSFLLIMIKGFNINH